MSSASLSLAEPMPASIVPEQLARCVRSLDPGTRALLDLSIRRRIRDDAMAPLLRTDPFHLAWRRARALERVASDLGGDDPAPLGDVRTALTALPDDVWAALPALSAPADQRPGTALLLLRDAQPLNPASSASLVPVERGQGAEVVVAGAERGLRRFRPLAWLLALFRRGR